MNTIRWWWAALILITATAGAHSQVRLEKAVIGMAGGRVSSSSTMMDYTVGQTAAGRASSTQSRGQFGFWTSPQIILSVQQGAGAGVVNNVSVFPNPIGSQGTVEITLAQSSNVEIALYDTRGALVRTLFSGNKGAGESSVPIDASAIASGTYFVAVSAPGALIQEPVTILR